jgi:hypothetical protein
VYARVFTNFFLVRAYTERNNLTAMIMRIVAFLRNCMLYVAVFIFVLS